jgi:hypothetical protein
MANKRIDQLNNNFSTLTGNEFIPIFNTSTNTTQRLGINVLSNFIGSSGGVINKIFDNGDSSPNLTLDFNEGNIQKFNLIGDSNLEFINGMSGGTYQVMVNQEQSIKYNINWPETILWSGGEFTNFKNINSRYITKLKFDVNPGSDIFDLTYDGNQYIISKR